MARKFDPFSFPKINSSRVFWDHQVLTKSENNHKDKVTANCDLTKHMKTLQIGNAWIPWCVPLRYCVMQDNQAGIELYRHYLFFQACGYTELNHFPRPCPFVRGNSHLKIHVQQTCICSTIIFVRNMLCIEYICPWNNAVINSDSAHQLAKVQQAFQGNHVFLLYKTCPCLPPLATQR